MTAANDAWGPCRKINCKRVVPYWPGLVANPPESRFAQRPAARLPNLVSAVPERCDKCLESR
jgi:hypothetical protein